MRLPIKTLPDSDPTVIAALWHDRLSGAPTPDDVAAFEHWRRATPQNAAEYARVVAGAAQTSALRDAPEMRTLRHEALAYLAENPPRGIRWRAAAAIALLLGVAGGAAWQHGLAPDPRSGAVAAAQTYDTGPGEKLAVTLADGSLVSLDGGTRIRVAYTAGARRITLDAGQALFKVAKAQDRPFVVSAREQEITAHGTEFDVRIDAGAVRVALLEGAVVVRNSRAGAASSVRMKPNDLLIIAGNSTTMARVSHSRQFAAQAEGLIQFEGTPLKDAVLQINRHLQHPILIGDDRIGEIRVSGSFPTGSSAAFVDAVQLSFPVRASADAQGRTILLRAE